MKTITITVNVDGNEVVRKFDYATQEAVNFGDVVSDMLDTIAESTVAEF